MNEILSVLYTTSESDIKARRLRLIKLILILKIAWFIFMPLRRVELWKLCHERSEFYNCNYDTIDASDIITVISRAKQA